MEERTRVTNGMIKDIVGVDCDACQHKNVCRFCESAETFIRDMKGAYPTGGAAPFVLQVTCTHKSVMATTSYDVAQTYPKVVPTITHSTAVPDDVLLGHVTVTATNGATAIDYTTGAEIPDNGSDKTDPTKLVTREL